MKGIKLTGKMLDGLAWMGWLYIFWSDNRLLASAIQLGICIVAGVILIQILRRKSRLNRYYTYSFKKQKQAIEIHFDPFFFFSFIDKKKLLQSREEALTLLREQFPECEILGKTMTIHSLNQRYTVVGKGSSFERMTAMIPSMFLTAANLRNAATFSLAEKLIKIIFINPLVTYRYAEKGDEK